MATGAEPWLALDWPELRRFAGQFVEIAYGASWWDRPCRPIFRFTQERGLAVDRIGVAPVLGRGLWTGRVPAGTIAVAVSPTDQIGRFDFRIEGIRRRATLSLLAEGARSNPRSTRSALLTRLIGWKPESDVNLAWAIGAQPLSRYGSWAARRIRPLDLIGLDRPRADWSVAPAIQIILTGGDDAEGLRKTVLSLQAQVFSNWTAWVVGGVPSGADSRVTPGSVAIAAASLTSDASRVTVVIAAGDRLLPEALAVVAEQAARHPEACLFYGDAVTRQGARREPIFRPGWSPRLQGAQPYIGMAFVRDVACWTHDDRLAFVRTGLPPVAWAAGLVAENVMPLRRILAEIHLEPPARTAPLPLRGHEASAAIIIPTRDHPALLDRIVTSIRARSVGVRHEIIVVDNGSVEPEAIALLARLGETADIRILSHPGPFNFSLMCNEAAAACESEVLVFLNDDMEILSDDWLDRLVARAMDPAVGAVGAKLTYPDGRLQHVGVLVGMGESAGHFGSLAPGDAVGWAGRNEVVHEVSAVTGACLAVARAKFDTVGGFDAVHLPIELSDIDLCLKLNARGWQTIVDPLVHLTHEESVSRGGATLRRLDVHGGERAIFIERWRHVLRDDRTFHPGLSLYRWEAALG